MVIVGYLTFKFPGFYISPKSPIVIDQRVLVRDHEFGRIEKKKSSVLWESILLIRSHILNLPKDVCGLGECYFFGGVFPSRKFSSDSFWCFMDKNYLSGIEINLKWVFPYCSGRTKKHILMAQKYPSMICLLALYSPTWMSRWKLGSMVRING